MKVTLKNLGLLKQAEFTLGDLTIICGGNNMGKTYATYALFGFLYFWEEFVNINSNYVQADLDIDDSKIDELISIGSTQINLQEILPERFDTLINSFCDNYTKIELAKVFASSTDKFKDAYVKINPSIDFDNVLLSNASRKFRFKIKDTHTMELEVTKNAGDLIMDFQLRFKSKIIEVRDGIFNTEGRSFLKMIAIDSITEFFVLNLFPHPFIISSERTGAATFRKELDFARNRMLKTIAHHTVNRDRETDIDNITSMLQQGYQDYPLPVEANVEFTRNLEQIVKQHSFIMDQYPEILNEFADMIGGNYQVTGEAILSYVPNKNKKLKLSLTESSSAIRSLLDLGFYLRHQAAVGDLLMIDEPELNLHPDNQRRIARLLARLVNLGIKVFITTHSSYIIKELNTLIMLNRDEPHLKQIATEENYLESELLSPDKVKVYVAKEALVQLDGQKKKTRSPTLVPAKISPELGIELTSFDTAIDTINRIQERIVWGSD
jgi:predicted ATPase